MKTHWLAKFSMQHLKLSYKHTNTKKKMATTIIQRRGKKQQRRTTLQRGISNIKEKAKTTVCFRHWSNRHWPTGGKKQDREQKEKTWIFGHGGWRRGVRGSQDFKKYAGGSTTPKRLNHWTTWLMRAEREFLSVAGHHIPRVGKILFYFKSAITGTSLFRCCFILTYYVRWQKGPELRLVDPKV